MACESGVKFAAFFESSLLCRFFCLEHFIVGNFIKLRVVKDMVLLTEMFLELKVTLHSVQIWIVCFKFVVDFVTIVKTKW